MIQFTNLSEYRRSEVSEGDQITVEYESKRSYKPGAPTCDFRGEISNIDDNGDDILLWITPVHRKSTHTVSLFEDDSNVHSIDGPGTVKTLNPTDTQVSCTVGDDG